MSLDSRADIIPYARFLDVRQRRQGIATATGTPALPPTDVSMQPELPIAAIDGERVATECSRACDSAEFHGATTVTDVRCL
jgi:hypothetical protein